MMRARQRLLAVTVVLFLHSAHLVHAQSSDLEVLLEQSIVSTPSKSAETSTTAPATSSVITAEELRRLGLRSLNEAINYVSLGMVTTETEHAVEIGARGVLLTGDYGNHVLLLIDGVPANEPWNGTAYFERGAGVPFELVDHIEVTLGPGSVMHGGQAMLGVINVVTKRARDFDGLRVILEGDTAAPVADNGDLQLTPLSDFGRGYRVGAGFGHAFEIGDTPAELTLQLELYRHDGPTWQIATQDWGDDSVTGQPKDFGPRSLPGQWGGTATRSNYVDAPAAYARLQVGRLIATLRSGIYTRASPYTDATVNVGDDFDDPRNNERDRWLQLGLSYEAALSNRASLGARVYGLLNDYRWTSHSSAAEECPDGHPNGCVRRLDGDGISGGADVRVTLDEPELNGSSVLGVDSRLRWVESDLDLKDRLTGSLDPAGNDYTRTDALVAPYMQQSFAPYDWLDFNAGLRLDYDTRFGAKLSPRAAVGVTAWRDGRLKAIYSEAFRAPTAYELNYTDPGSQIASPHLSAESVRSIELSMEQRFGTHRLFFGVFRSSWFDMVNYRTLSDQELEDAIDGGALQPNTDEAYAYANAGSLVSYGYNAAYEGSVARRLHFGANLTSSFTRVDLGDGPQPPTVGPTLFGNARVSYDLGTDWPTLGLAAQYVAKRPADRAFDGGFARAPYAPADMRLRVTLTGEVPSFTSLRYRLSATYATAASTPYVTGPNQYASDETTVAALAPQRRLTAFLGLEYVLP